MNKRDDFSESVKKTLASRAGHRCSFPTCRRKTIGPSSETVTAVSSTGDAAHIVAASGGPGARRVRNIPSDQRKAYENGIWMCATHARMIDRDEIRFSIPMLEAWKSLAEYLAQLEHDHGKVIVLSDANTLKFEIVEEAVVVNSVEMCSQRIGDAFADCCVLDIWGSRLGKIVRDAIIELAFNAFNHGDATEVRVQLGPGAIIIEDNGTLFDPTTLGKQGRVGGGSQTIEYLTAEFSESLLISYQHAQGKNHTRFCLVRTTLDIRRLTTCYAEKVDSEFNASSYPECDQVFLFLPRYMVISQGFGVTTAIKDLKTLGKKVVLVVTDISDLTKEKIRQTHPDLRIIFTREEVDCDLSGLELL